MQNNRKNYYEFTEELEEMLAKAGMVDDIFYLKDLNQRKLFITDNIDQYSVGGIVRHIMQYNAEDREIPITDRKPIILYLVSNGGSVDAGFELIDAITASKTPVYTVNLGYQYSMGFLIGLSGHKRFAFQNAKFLMHDGSNMIWDSGAKAQDQMEFQKRVEGRIKRYILDHSSITSDEYDSKYRVEWYLFADEAKEKGFVDYIIGVDCDIDEVV